MYVLIPRMAQRESDDLWVVKGHVGFDKAEFVFFSCPGPLLWETDHGGGEGSAPCENLRPQILDSWWLLLLSVTLASSKFSLSPFSSFSLSRCLLDG